MTQGYLACAFLDNRPRDIPAVLLKRLEAQGWSERWRARGLLLFACDRLPVRPLRDRDGVVIGTLFDRSGDQAADEPASDLSPDGARDLVDLFWGNYVALSASAGRASALRDPSGGLACYHAAANGVRYFTSRPHLLIDSGLIAADIDWDVVGTSLTRHALREPITALRGIEEVLAGELLTANRDRTSSRPIWDPWAHAAAPRLGDPAAQLEQALSTTFLAWGRSIRRPLIEISGGLDSAIVAAGMAPAAPDACLITFAAAPGDPDETGYARAIAEHLALPLEIAVPRIEEVDLARSLSCDLPRPNARAFTQAADAQSLSHARRIGADAFMSGGGGDDIFCYLRTILPAVDRLRAEGWRAMADTALDIAIMTHSTLGEAVARILRRLMRGGSAKRALELQYIGARYRTNEAWSAPADRDLPGAPGKTAHVGGILSIHNYLEGHKRSAFAPILSPLLSQPVVECCLGIPTWLWCDQGRNRAVARDAFARHLPRIVLERRSKGSFDAFCARLLDLNRELVRELLVGGRLAREGLIDAAAIDAALANPFLPAETVARILGIVDVETWVRSWTARSS